MFKPSIQIVGVIGALGAAPLAGIAFPPSAGVALRLSHSVVPHIDSVDVVDDEDGFYQIPHSRADGEVHLSYGIVAFRQGRMAEARVELIQAKTEDPRSGLAWYWLGLLHRQQDELDEAVTAFERSLAGRWEVESWEPLPHFQVIKELAEILLDRGDAAKALRYLGPMVRSGNADASIETLYTRTLDELGRERVIALDQARKRDSKLWGRLEQRARLLLPPTGSRWHRRATAAIGGDSNPTLRSESLQRVSNAQLASGSDSNGLSSLGLRVDYSALPRRVLRPSNTARSLRLSLSLDANQSLHQDPDRLDRTDLRAVGHLSWGGDPSGYLVGPKGYAWVPMEERFLSVLIQGDISLTLLDADSQRRGSGGSIALAVRPQRWGQTQLDLTFEETDFFANARAREERESGHETAFEVGQYFFLGSRSRYLRLGWGRGQRNAGADFDTHFTTAALDVAMPITQRSTFFFGARLRQDEFDSAAASAAATPQRRRTDETWTGTAMLLYALGPRLHLFARAQNGQRDSNVHVAPGDEDFFDYKRTAASLGLTWFF